MKFINRFKLHIIGLVLGAIGGWFYWYAWGCVESCPIKSNPLHSSLYGALMGFLFLGMFEKKHSNIQ